MTMKDKTKKATAPAPTPPADKSRRLEIQSVPGKSVDRLTTDLMAEGVALNAVTAVRFVQHEHGGLSLTDMVASLQEQGKAVNRGDLSSAERMLNSQAVALNAIFGEMARRASLNMGEYVGATDTFMRLALKAQSQCRATLETLSVIKNPPVVFAKQMNVANGPQQVNNGPRTLEKPSTPNELFEGLNHARTQMDTRTAPATSREDSRLVPVGEVNRAAHA